MWIWEISLEFLGICFPIFFFNSACWNDGDISPSNDFKGTNEEAKNFPPSEDFSGTDDNDIPTQIDISLTNENINDVNDGYRNQDPILSQSTATIKGGKCSPIGYLNIVEHDDNIDDDTPNMNIQETIACMTISKTRNRPLYINPNHSSYTRCMKELLLS